MAVSDKTTDTVAQLIIEEIFPRHGCALQIVSDNGTENVNLIVIKLWQNSRYILTSVCHPLSSAKVERFHRTLQEVFAKKIADKQHTWDWCLNQALCAIRINVSELSKFSPFFLLYNRDVVMAIDNSVIPYANVDSFSNLILSSKRDRVLMSGV